MKSYDAVRASGILHIMQYNDDYVEKVMLMCLELKHI